MVNQSRKCNNAKASAARGADYRGSAKDLKVEIFHKVIRLMYQMMSYND